MPGRAKPGQPKSTAKQTVGTRRGNGVGKGPAKGEGWGGPASGGSAPQYVAGEVREGQGKGRTAPYVQAREERIKALKDKLFDLATAAQREETQLAATVAYLNREEGLPVARQLTATTDEARLLRIEIIDAGADAETAGSPAVPAADND